MQMLADLRPNEERAKMFVLTVPKSTGVQAGPLMSEHQVRKLSETIASTCQLFTRPHLQSNGHVEACVWCYR